MDLQAMRGGILDARRARNVVDGLGRARAAFETGCATATRVARFLSTHPRVEAVHHPSLAGHPDAVVVARHYRLPGSIVSFRVSSGR